MIRVEFEMPRDDYAYIRAICVQNRLTFKQFAFQAVMKYLDDSDLVSSGKKDTENERTQEVQPHSE